jgi:CRP/FNR family transcriptional regulator
VNVEILKSVDLFSRLSPPELARLASICREQRFSAGERLIEQDTLTSALFIVRAGEVRVERSAGAGKRDVLRKFGPGEVVGEMSLVDDLLASADVIASGDVECIAIPKRDFHELLERDDKLAHKVYKGFARVLSERLRQANISVAALRDLAGRPREK